MKKRTRLHGRIYLYCKKNQYGWQVKAITSRPDKKAEKLYHAECWMPEGSAVTIGDYVAIKGTREGVRV